MPQNTIKRLCVFGSHEESELYSRNRVLIDAISACADQVVTVSPGSRTRKAASNHGRLESLSALTRTAFETLREIASLASQRSRVGQADCCFVAYPAYLDVALLRLLFPGRSRPKLVVDAFLCLHDTVVNDRRMIAADGMLARWVRRLEGWTLRAADLVFIDTEQQKSLLVNDYDLDEDKVIVVPVGIDETQWQPLPPTPLAGSFTVLFWGTFIPLHGVDTIVRAAHYLQVTHPEIRFELVGDGQTADSVAGLIDSLKVTNVTWKRALLPTHELRTRLESAHCVLGIFGETDKAGNVIPYKAYQALASNKILVSRESPAFARLLGGESVPGLILVPPASSEVLAAAIAELYDDYDQVYLTVGTRTLYERELSTGVVRERVAQGVARL